GGDAVGESRQAGERSVPGDGRHLSDMRIVLLGNKAAGKSSCVATVLDVEDSGVRTAQCVKSQGQAAGRHTTLVEAPGWWSNYLVKDTLTLHAQEVQRSRTLCPPGPHDVLLLVCLDTRFTEKNRRALEERVELLTDVVWRHCLVVFTYGDHLGGVTIEKHIEAEGPDLQWLVEKCGTRFHVLNNKNRKDRRQVTELLENIEEMVEGNGGRHFEMEGVWLHNMEMETKQLRVVVVGHRHSGKSSVGNTILGRKEFDLRRTSKCASRQGEVAGRLVSVVEAPGWWNTYRLVDSLQLNKQELQCSVSLCPPGPHALLLTLRADGSFTRINRMAIEEHLGIFGERIWNHTMWLVEKCGNRYNILENGTAENIEGGREEPVASIVTGICYLIYIFTLVLCHRYYTAHLRAQDGAAWRYSGKSSAGNTIFGRKHFPSERSSRCVRRQGRVGEKEVVVVEAPGWWRSRSVELTPESDKEELVRSVRLCAPGPHALLLVIQADASFTETESRVLREHVELLGATVWNHILVLFTCGDWLGETPIEQHIEGEGDVLQRLVDTCRNRYHVLNNQDRAGHTQVTELLDKVEEMVARNDGYFLVEVPKPPPPKTKRKHGEDDEEKGKRTEGDEEKTLQTDGEDVQGDAEDAPAFTEQEKTWNVSDFHIRKADSM
ncbi:hypothetical protein P4O66_017504, partial [Electrophorus voltai]